MKYKFGYIPSFAKELKTLCKKYKSLKKDFEALKEEIETNPNIGVSLGEGLRKIRLNISSKKQRKKWWSKSNYSRNISRNRLSRNYVGGIHFYL